MTKAEIEAQWKRFMHRNDIDGDLPAIWEYVQQQIYSRSFAEIYGAEDDIAGAAPRACLHSGLSYLHELAQDNDGLGRERDRFEEAMTDLMIGYSVTLDPHPQMARPYHPEDY